MKTFTRASSVSARAESPKLTTALSSRVFLMLIACRCSPESTFIFYTAHQVRNVRILSELVDAQYNHSCASLRSRVSCPAEISTEIDETTEQTNECHWFLIWISDYHRKTRFFQEVAATSVKKYSYNYSVIL